MLEVKPWEAGADLKSLFEKICKVRACVTRSESVLHVETRRRLQNSSDSDDLPEKPVDDGRVPNAVVHR